MMDDVKLDWQPMEYGGPTIDQPFGYGQIVGKDCRLWVSVRPAYCDRGRFLVHFELLPGKSPADLNVDEADRVPRYYFHRDCMDREMATWLRVRGQWVEP